MAPRVLWLGWGFPPNVTGGLDTYVGEMFDGLRARGVDVELILPAEYAPEGRDGIVGVPTGDGDIITRIGRLSAEFADRAADRDIIHTHDWFGYGPASRAKSTSPDVEWITTFHSLSSDRNIDPPEREVETERRIVQRADHLLAVSHLLARKLNEEYGGDASVIHNGFSECQTTDRDVRAELDVHGPMLFFVGRHTDQKGISHLLYAMERLDDDVTLVVGGKGHLTDQLKRFAELIGVADQVRFVGYIPEVELGDYYAAADVFVSPSLSEPFGITITEALSVGTRVVATECGVAEILPEDVVIPADPDSASLARAIERALSMDGPLEYEPRTWDDVVDETLAFYERLV